ncbi:MAG: glycosyltransferase family 2 protein [Thiotrichales bacterium]|nr:glycosyltransferase family 2 protein [Thiotrichales bacterium]
MKLVVIMPTYNEVGNIRPMLDALDREFMDIDHDCHVLVVDDNSPDGTGDLVRQYARDNPRIHLLSGDKAGLGAAYLRGMDHALNKMQADAVFEMDADFSHDPADLKRLVAEFEDGADFVIGSRYVKGGTVPGEWGFMRRLNSLGGNFVARFIAGIYRVRDCTAGFRLIRGSLLRAIDFDQIKTLGYAFQVALLYEAVIQKAVIREIPVHFTDRKYGESKLGLRDILEFLYQIGGIRFRSYKTFVKFCLVGASGVIVNLGSMTVLMTMGVNKYIASPIAIEISIITNFLFNNYWTFRNRNNKSHVRIRGLKFNAVSFVALLVSYGTFVVLSFNFPDTAPQVHQFLGIIPATLVNYFLNSYWTFSGDKG